MAEMATHCFAGNIARGMTMVVLSNGGGVGVSRCINGGNGIVLDGSERMDEVVKSGLSWDVMGGIARRAWAQNEGAIKTGTAWNEKHSAEGNITLAEKVDEEMVKYLVNKEFGA
jgi:urocanate hydratase